MMEGLPHDKYGDSIRLMLGTGIRMHELLALEPRLIEEDGSVIHIRQAVKNLSGRVEIGVPKSRDSVRDVPVPEGLRPIVIGLRSTEDTYIFQSPKKGAALRSQDVPGLIQRLHRGSGRCSCADAPFLPTHLCEPDAGAGR